MKLHPAPEPRLPLQIKFCKVLLKKPLFFVTSSLMLLDASSGNVPNRNNSKVRATSPAGLPIIPVIQSMTQLRSPIITFSG